MAARGPLAGVIVASPANPTGTMLSEAELRALYAWCAARRAWLVSDEIYHGITFGTVRETSAVALGPAAIVVNSFSKRASPPARPHERCRILRRSPLCDRANLGLRRLREGVGRTQTGTSA